MNQEQHWGYTVNEWESGAFKEMLDEAFKEKPRLVFDVGACVGGWSYVVSKNYGAPAIRAFEPYNPNFEALKHNCIDHELDNVFPENVAIFYGKETADAYWRGGNVGAIFVDEVDTTDRVYAGQEFKLKTLEDFSYHIPDVVKLDVEGAEKNIIENSSVLRHVPQIIVEWHDDKINGAEYFKQYLTHKVILNMQNGMYLLRL